MSIFDMDLPWVGHVRTTKLPAPVMKRLLTQGTLAVGCRNGARFELRNCELPETVAGPF